MSKAAGNRTSKAGGTLPTLPAMNDWTAVAIIVAAVAVFFRDILLQNAFLWEDFLYQYYPNRTFAAVSMSMGQLPLWNPFTFNGVPFQADIQSALFYPPNMLLTLFVSGGQLNFYWLELQVIAHIMIGGVGMYFLAREFKLQSLPALFSGLVFALSGFMITHAIHQPIICQVAWFPIITLLFRRALLRSSVKYMIVGGLLLGMAVLAGFPQISLYFFFFLLLYFLFEFISTTGESGFRKASPMIPLAGGVVVIALALAALQLLPTIELAPQSQRAEITYTKSLEGSLSWTQLILGISPKFFGASGAAESTYWGPGVYWSYWETSFYLGIAGLVAILFAIPLARKNRNVAFFLGIIVFTLLYVTGDGFFLHKFFYSVVPGFSKFRSIGRLTILTTLAGALVAGFGMEEFLRRASGGSARVRNAIFAVAGVALVFWLAVNAGFLQPSGNAQAYEQVHAIASAAAITTLILSFVVAALLWFNAKGSIAAGMFCILLIAVQFIDINIFGSTQNNSPTSPREYYGRTSQLVDFIREQGKNELFRVNSRSQAGMVLDRNQGMVDRIYLMEGYTPLALQRMFPLSHDFEQLRNLSNVKYYVTTDEAQRSLRLAEATNYFPRAFMVYGVQVFSDEATEKAYLTGPEYNPARAAVLEEQPVSVPADTAFTHDWTASMTSYGLDAMTIDITTPKDGYCVLSEIYYPGWHARIDGNEVPLYRADWCLRAFPVPAGKHHVDVAFEPAPFRRGLWITVITLVCSIAGLVITMKRRPAPATTPEA
jgi:hypothetical protein